MDVVVVLRPGVPFENTNDKPAALRVVAVVLIVVNIVAVLFIYLLLRRRLVTEKGRRKTVYTAEV